MGLFKAHYNLEKHSVALVIAIMLAGSVGGLVEIVPLFTIDQTVVADPDMRVYTPLELAGRNIYIREGCYACHSQMIRTLRDDVERYGPYSLPWKANMTIRCCGGPNAPGRILPGSAANIRTSGMWRT
jgi:cytochrome c oxidase cbb3-type subunit 2